VRPTIAVLPFEDLSGNAEYQYFADGMVEDVIVALSRLGPLQWSLAVHPSFTGT